MQYIPHNSALFAQETQFLTQKADPGGVWDSKHKFSAKTHFLQKGSFSPADLAENLCVDSQTRVWTKTLVYVDFQDKNITKGP